MENTNGKKENQNQENEKELFLRSKNRLFVMHLSSVFKIKEMQENDRALVP
jgi:hypothetical protein